MAKGDMDYIRNAYRVPAKRGRRVTVNGWPGVIISADGAYLVIRQDSDNISRRYHPTDERIIYMADSVQQVEPAPAGGEARP